MKTFNLNDLNTEQRLALQDTEGPVLVTAGAGSGKTRLLTYRIAHLIKDKGVDPSNILAITFTNKAANEMKTRLEDMVEGADKIWVSTFHALCCKILRKNIVAFQNKVNLKRETEYRKGFDNNFSIYSDSDKDKILKDVFAKNNITDEKIMKNAVWHISNAKNKNLSPLNYQREYMEQDDIDTYAKIYNSYQIELENNNALDFDDLLTKTYELFVTCPEILSYYQNKFLYIHIDEFQDTNTVQYQIVSLLAQKYRNIFAVGDEDQCIYGWRGANISNILDFKKDFEDCRTFKLEQNYRSTKNILNSANSLIKYNSIRNPKTLWTENNDGVRVEYYTLQDENAEAEYVASNIYNLVKNSGYRYGDIAVLMRMNALTRPFEEKFLNYNIPHKVFGGFKFFERQEIKAVLSYLRLLVNPQDSSALMRIINFPRRGIGDASIKELETQSKYYSVGLLTLILNKDEEFFLADSIQNKFDVFKNLYLDLLENMKVQSPTDFVRYMLSKIDFKKAYASGSEEDLSKLMNIDAFVQSVDEYFDLNPNSNLEEYLQSVTLSADIDSYDESNNAVALATVHSVKGLEFKVVFIIGVEDRVFPLIRFGANSQKDMEEERRLMYVAITRAEQRLYITNTKSRFMYGRRDYMMPSKFVNEINLNRIRSNDFGSASIDSSNNAYSKNNYNFASYESSKVSFSMPTSNSLSATQKASTITDFKVGSQVLHTKFGIGTITKIENASKLATVEFKDFGVKTLSLEYAPLKVIKGE